MRLHPSVLCQWSLDHPVCRIFGSDIYRSVLQTEPAGQRFDLRDFGMFISNLFIWKEFIPTSGFIFYIMNFMMSLSTALAYFIDRIYTKRLKGIISTFILPCVFVVLEFLSVSINPGGSFGALSTTQSSLPFLQLVSITGIWGITFFIYWSAAMINWLLDNDLDNTLLRKALWVFVLPAALVVLFGEFRLSSTLNEDTVKIASVNISKNDLQNIYNDQPDLVNRRINETFLRYCEIAALSEAKIVFGNETMLNMNSDEEEEYIEKAKAVAEKNGIYIGLPLLIYPINDTKARPMNKITWISPQKEILFSYFKAKPTPGEGSYGDGVIQYFDSPYGRISSVICFDMDFPGLIRQVRSMNIDIMLVPGNDWKDITPYHTYAASFRAIEQGFNLVRSASRGLSASFHFTGRVLSYQDCFTTNDAVFYSDVPTKGQGTVYAVIGDSFAWFCLLFFILTTVLLLVRKKEKDGSTQ